MQSEIVALVRRRDIILYFMLSPHGALSVFQQHFFFFIFWQPYGRVFIYLLFIYVCERSGEGLFGFLLQQVAEG